MRLCRKCGLEINGNALGNRIKIVGKETKQKWILRHIRQFFSLFLNGFVKPDIEGYTELCDECYNNLQLWLDKE